MTSTATADAAAPDDSGFVWGALRNREAHVLPEPDGSLTYPTWLNGLPTQRRLVREDVARIVNPTRRHVAGRRAARVGAHAVSQLGAAIVTDAAWRYRRGDLAEIFARRLRLLFESLGPTYIKLGQIVSGGPGLFPDVLVNEFEKCRDAVPAFAWDEVQRVLAEDLPGGVNAFADLDPQPFAAASIAQVHHATLHDGRAVVVKIQRPGLAPKVRADLELLAILARTGLRYSEALHAANPLAIVEYAAETLFEELDFRLEAENQLDVHEAVMRSSVRDGVAVPRPHPRLVTRRVLTMERLEGFPYVDSDAAVAAGIDTEAMLKAGFGCFVEGAIVHGVFHGDLHGGNIMVCPDGRYGILDYGIVGRLSPRERSAFASMMAAMAQGDVRAQVAAIQAMGAIPPDADLDAVVDEMPKLPFFELRMPDAQEIADMMKGTIQTMLRLDFQLPKLLILLTKNLIFLEDAVARFAPGVDMLGDFAAVFMGMSDALAKHDPYADALALPGPS